MPFSGLPIGAGYAMPPGPACLYLAHSFLTHTVETPIAPAIWAVVGLSGSVLRFWRTIHLTFDSSSGGRRIIPVVAILRILENFRKGLVVGCQMRIMRLVCLLLWMLLRYILIL